MERIKSQIPAAELRTGDIMHFQPGSKPFTVKEADYVFINFAIPSKTANFKIETDCGSVFFLRGGDKVFIARKPDFMVLIKRDHRFCDVKAGSVLPAHGYSSPAYGEIYSDLLYVQAEPFHFGQLVNVAQFVVSTGDVEIVEVLS